MILEFHLKILAVCRVKIKSRGELAHHNISFVCDICYALEFGVINIVIFDLGFFVSVKAYQFRSHGIGFRRWGHREFHDSKNFLARYQIHARLAGNCMYINSVRRTIVFGAEVSELNTG